MVQFDIQTAPHTFEMMWFHPLLILKVMATTVQVHATSSSVCTIGELTCYADPAPGQGKNLKSTAPIFFYFFLYSGRKVTVCALHVIARDKMAQEYGCLRLLHYQFVVLNHCHIVKTHYNFQITSNILYITIVCCCCCLGYTQDIS